MRKQDEMEMHITFQALRVTYLFINIFLLIWMFYDFIKFQNVGLPLILTLSQVVVFFGSRLYLTRKMNENEE